MSQTKWCPPNHNPLYHLVDPNAYTSSCVVGITGFKRNCKSLLLARMLVYDMLVLKRKVWSTMPVQTPDSMVKDYGMQHSLPIDWDTLYMLAEEYEDGTIGLDESIYYDDSRTSLSMRNKLLNTIMNQVGHRNLNVYYTVKQQGWLDRRLQFETDLEIRCSDLGRTSWGRRNEVTKGTLVKMQFFDKTAFLTNRPSGNRPFQTILWRDADKYWSAYDTKEVIGIEDLMTGVKVDMKQRVISNKHGYDEDIQNTLYGIASEFRSKGNESIPCETFWGLASRLGIDGDSRQLGKHLTALGVTRKEKRGGNIYDLSKLVVKGE